LSRRKQEKGHDDRLSVESRAAGERNNPAATPFLSTSAPEVNTGVQHVGADLS
jgi:hypothetical protein